MQQIKCINKVDSTITLPGSKSYTNRALIISSLADGKTVLRRPLISDDTLHMVNCLRQLGVKIKRTKNNYIVDGRTFKASKMPLFIGNSGTSARFLTALAALVPGTTTIKGDKQMQKRPIKDLLSALGQLGIKTECRTGCPPLKIYGGKFSGGKCTINGKNSSQYLSALLMVAPYAVNDTLISVKNALASKPFIDMTLDIMRTFGVKVTNKGYKEFFIKCGQRYQCMEYTIEPDMTAASYFFAAPAIVGGRIKITNLNPNTKQGDIKFINLLRNMGCLVKKGKNYVEIINSRKKLKSLAVDMNSMPDVAQTLAVVALFADGTTKIRNISNLRIKETDRIKATATELRKLGAVVKETNSSLMITPSKLKPAKIETYHDHRMAMSFSLAGLKIPGIKIKNPGCVNKTFPQFWSIIKKLK